MSSELDRHTIDTQDEIINDLREENERLRVLLKASRKLLHHYCISDELIKRIDKEVCDES